jgi:diaminohydroxyphosphoribosylaminopyrimidine deaminase / 5-amino-6-(5-phosphoribosylamino)uracil reductase
VSATAPIAKADADNAASWRALNLLAARVREHDGLVTSCTLLVGDEPDAWVGPGAQAGEGRLVSVIVRGDGGELPSLRPGESRYALDDLIGMEPVGGERLPPPVAAIIELYVPYCLAAAHARAMGRAFAVSHFAQSLDGRIATTGGDARWIGCDENQLHAHRMRALCDAILIGARTLRRDRPSLTVRHTEGDDPVRVVLGDADDVCCLEQAGPGAILVIGCRDGAGRASSDQVQHVVLPSTDGRISTRAILEALYRNDILSVYIEGGAITTSRFLAERNIDVLQLHISPMIIGPGVSAFGCPSIESVAESVRFGPHVYRSIGDGIMFVGRVAL